MYTKKFYGHETAAVDLLKIYFLKNPKKTCKPNNRDLSRVVTIAMACSTLALLGKFRYFLKSAYNRVEHL